MKPIECVIFDCDGVLVDSEPLSNLALEITLRDSGIDETASALLDEFKGWKLAQLCTVIEARHARRLKQTFVADYRRLVEKLFSESLRPIDGVAAMLAAVSLPKCVASSGPPEKIKLSLTLTGLKLFFSDHVFSSYVVQSWKPEPGLFLHAARAMGFAPAQCAVIEDSDVGIQAALNAGMRAFRYASENVALEEANVVHFDDMRLLPDLLIPAA